MLFFPILLNGQDSNARSGSPYSSIAAGEPHELYSAGTIGMGLYGVALFDTYSPNSANPALWGVSAYTLGSLGLGYQNYSSSDGFDSAVFNQFTIDRFQLVLPLIRSELGLSLGFSPVTRSSFNLSNEGALQLEPGRDPVDFLNSVEGSGGVNKMEAGIGYRFSDNFAIGYAASVYFTSLEREHRTSFDSQDFSTLSYTESFSGNAFGHRFGFYGRAGDLMRDNDEFAFGASVNLPVSLDTDRNVSAFRTVGGQFRSVELLPENADRNGTIEMPLEFFTGLTYRPNSLFNVSIEYSEHHWGDVEYSFNSTQEGYLVNRSRIGAGAQYHPYRQEGRSGFFTNFKYSAGVTYDTGHLEIENNTIDTLLFHSGIGILSQRTASSIDLSFHFGFRGTEDHNLVKETVWGFKLSFNLAEIMFVQTRFN